MDLKIVNKTDDEVFLEFQGESHTLLNLLRTELLVDERTLIATYDNKFPIMAFPIFRLKTKDADPLEVMKEAVSRIIAQCEEFSALYSAAVK
jgi:DNA-directed RNA polymerase subunit L